MVAAPILQGRSVTPEILDQVRGLIGAHADWSRRRLALELCQQWGWRNAAGQIKDMAARCFLDKLEESGWVQLPPRQNGECLRARSVRRKSKGRGIFARRSLGLARHLAETVGPRCSDRPLAPIATARRVYKRSALVGVDVLVMIVSAVTKGYFP